MPDASALQIAPRILSYRGIPVTEERPRGFIQRGVGEDGRPWARIYGYDRRTGEALPGFITYGDIPGTASDDGEALDAYLGSDLDAQLAYVIEQGGADPELKIVLGVPDIETAILYYTAHVPEEMLASVRAVPLELIQNLLGVAEGAAVEKSAVRVSKAALRDAARRAHREEAIRKAAIYVREKDVLPPTSVTGGAWAAADLAGHPCMTAPLSGAYTGVFAAGGWLGWIEPEPRPDWNPRSPHFPEAIGAANVDSTGDWIAFVNADGRGLLWPQRYGGTGAVLGDPILFHRAPEMLALDRMIVLEEARRESDADLSAIYETIMKRDPTTIQTLIFDRSKFTALAARAWAKGHGFENAKIDETEDSYRLRQIDPDAFDASTFRTIELRPGVKAVVGVRRAVQKAMLGEPVMKVDGVDRNGKPIRFALFPVLEPLDPNKGEADTQGDFYSEETIREGMWWYMAHHQNTMLLHIRQGGTIVNDRVVLVENYQTKNDEMIEGSFVKKGTWLVGYHIVDDDIWQMLIKGEIQAVSIEGLAERVPVASVEGAFPIS